MKSDTLLHAACWLSILLMNSLICKMNAPQLSTYSQCDNSRYHPSHPHLPIIFLGLTAKFNCGIYSVFQFSRGRVHVQLMKEWGEAAMQHTACHTGEQARVSWRAEGLSQKAAISFEYFIAPGLNTSYFNVIFNHCYI